MKNIVRNRDFLASSSIVRNALHSPQTATPSAIDAMSTLIANKMQYAKRITPNEHRVEAVKGKTESGFLASSSNSEEEEGQGSKKKKKNRKIDMTRGSRSSQENV